MLNETPLFNYKGMKLTMTDMSAIDRYYKTACTAEFILDNYPIIESWGEAVSYATEARRLMDKYDYTEIEAVETVMVPAYNK